MSVTARQELCKQPAEKRKFLMDFANKLAVSEGEELSSIISVTSETINGDVSDLTITLETIVSNNATNSAVEFWIEGGTSGLKYRVEVRVNTNAGQILEGDGILKVTDR